MISDVTLTLNNICEPVTTSPAIPEYLDDAINPTGCYSCDTTGNLKYKDDTIRVC